MVFAPCEKRKIEATNGEKEKRSRDNQRENVGGIDAGETCPPEVGWAKVRAFVGVDKDESGKHEEKIDADEADASEILIPPGTAGQNSDDTHVKEDNVKGGEETQSRQGVEARPHVMSLTSLEGRRSYGPNTFRRAQPGMAVPLQPLRRRRAS